MFTYGEYRVHFKHVRHDAEWSFLAHTDWWATTICWVTYIDLRGLEEEAYGIRAFKLGEPFSRPVGRKDAFAQMLKKWQPRENRIEWWLQFARWFPNQPMGKLSMESRVRFW